MKLVTKVQSVVALQIAAVCTGGGGKYRIFSMQRQSNLFYILCEKGILLGVRQLFILIIRGKNKLNLNFAVNLDKVDFTENFIAKASNSQMAYYSRQFMFHSLLRGVLQGT